jgi:metal-responsive CopG/Arc/MetJ family transcriptional regulator
MKTAISIPDDLHSEVERLARRLNRSRSRLYADAAREYVARHDPDAVTDALNRVCDAVQADIDPAVAAAGTRLLERVEW